MDATAESPIDITLRSVTAEDREFLLKVYAAGREIELSLVPWDEAMKRTFVEHQYDAQDAYYRQEMPGSVQYLILQGEDAVGRIYLDRTSDEIAILDLAILKTYRRRGIATRLIGGLQEEARDEQKSIRIFIESFNPAASLLRKLGFTLTSNDGMNQRYDWRTN